MMDMKRIFLALSVIAVVIACNKSECIKKADNNGFLAVRLTDAPALYDSVNVDVVGVEVHSNTTGWVSLAIPAPGIYNLLQYTNGLDTLLATTTLPAGTISQIRLILGANNAVTKNGITYPMTVPSGSESGLKLQVHSDIVAGDTTIMQLDFDAASSVVEEGNGDFHLKPVLRAVIL